MKGYFVYKVVTCKAGAGIYHSAIIGGRTYCLTYDYLSYTVPRTGTLICAFATKEAAVDFTRPRHSIYLKIWLAHTHYKPVPIRSLWDSPDDTHRFKRFWKDKQYSKSPSITGIWGAVKAPSNSVGCKDLRLVKEV